jgi:hypothetical protein
MADIFKIFLTPEDVDDRTAYLVFKDGFDGTTEDIEEDDWVDPILCDNDGYIVESVEKVDKLPKNARPYEV